MEIPKPADVELLVLKMESHSFLVNKQWAPNGRSPEENISIS
jgi:hypothetical protein